MRSDAEERLRELEAELESGRRLEAEMELRLGEVRRDLLRVAGAAQVLRELLGAEAIAETEPVETERPDPVGAAA